MAPAVGSQAPGSKESGPPAPGGKAPGSKASRRRSSGGAAPVAVSRPPQADGRVASGRPAVTRQTVRRLDLWTVLKVSLAFYLVALAALILAFVVLWLVASSFGVVSDVEDFMTSLLSTKDFTFLSTRLLIGMALVGLVLVTLLTLITVIAAAFYNLFADTIGGIEVILVEDQLDAGA